MVLGWFALFKANICWTTHYYVLGTQFVEVAYAVFFCLLMSVTFMHDDFNLESSETAPSGAILVSTVELSFGLTDH